MLIITCHCIIYCVAYWFITCHSTRIEAACSLGLFVFSLLPLRIMLETPPFFFNFLWKYGSKNHTFQICSCYLFASWVSLFFFQTPSPFRGDDVIPQFFLQHSLCSLLFLRTIYSFLLDRILSCWNSIYNDFPVSLKSHIDTHRVFLSHHSRIFQLFISFGFRGIVECMTF